MAFKKAESKQAFLKIGLYGPQGSGKTLTALLLAEGLAARSNKRIAYVDTERGTDFYSQDIPERVIHPNAFDFDAIYTRSLATVTDEIKALDPNVYGVVVIDSISHLWDSAIAAYEGKQTSIGTIPMNAWAAIKRPYKKVIQTLLDMPVHVLILGRQKNEFEKDAKGELVKTGVAMRAEGETEYEPHICARFEASYKKDGALAGVLMIVEKDRSGILHGRTIPNPTFAAFEPLLPFLGTQQAVSEDQEEVLARDGELLANDEAKLRERSDKSRELHNQFNAAIVGASSMDDLVKIAAEVKKQKRYLNGEHHASLLALYTDKNKELAAKLAPTEI